MVNFSIKSGRLLRVSSTDTIKCALVIVFTDFFVLIRKNWERTPIHIKRDHSTFYANLISTPLLDKVLREHNVFFDKNIDITSYSNGKRETHNPPGRAVPSIVWDYYQNNCSVRMLNPQTFIPQLHCLNGKNAVKDNT